MKIVILLVSGFLGAAGAAAGAQTGDAARAALLSRMGVEPSGSDFVYAGAILAADDLQKIDGFAAALEAAPDPDAALGRIDLEELAAEGRAPDSPSIDGTVWFAKSPDGWELTDAGRRAVPGIVLKSSSQTVAKTASSASPVKPLDIGLPASRIGAIVAASGNPGFDGSSSSVQELPDAPSATLALNPAASPVGVKTPVPGPKQKESKLEKDAFWSTWYGYHAAFAADFVTTGMILEKGGYETDHLYTQFGDKNMAGVIGSALVVHAAVSVASVELHNAALKKHGFWRAALETAAIGINSFGVVEHTTQGAIHNIGVLDNWNSR